MLLPSLSDRQTAIYQFEGGTVSQPIDSHGGQLFRPFGARADGGRLATLETLYDFFINHVPDPDEALRQDPDILEKINNQADVIQCLRKRSFTVAQQPWKINPAQDVEDEELAEKVARYVQWVLKQLPNIEQLFEQMETAIIPGGIGIELVWNREADGTERPVQFWSVHKSRFLFDRLGNLCLRTRDYPVWGVHTGANPGITGGPTLQPTRGKFLYHVYRREPGSWEKPELEGYQYYGKGEDTTLYIPVTFDHFCHRFQMKWIERFGVPPTVVYHPLNESAANIVAVARSLRGESVISVPRQIGPNNENSHYMIEQLDVPSPSFDAFESYYRERTKNSIGGILLGSVDEMSKSESGSYSDHVSRRDSGPMIYYAYDAKCIAATINHQLIPTIIDHSPFKDLPTNYYPAFVMEPKEEKDQLQQVQVLNETAKAVHVPEDEYYDRAGIRKPNAGERTVFLGAQPMGDGMDFSGGPEGADNPTASDLPNNPSAAAGKPGQSAQGGGAQKPGMAPKTPVGQSAGSRKTGDQ